MRITKQLLLLAVLGLTLTVSARSKVASPDGRLTVLPEKTGLTVCYDKQPVLQIPTVGYERTTNQLKLKAVGNTTARYTMLSGKRRLCQNEGHEYAAQLGGGVRMVLRLYNDGMAFRYEAAEKPQQAELTAYRIPEGMNRWMQQWADSYEGFFPLQTTAKVKPVPSYGKLSVSPDGFNNRWGYPALLEPVEGCFVLLTEANIEHGQSASCLYNDGDLFRVVPDDNPAPTATGWHTPWRVAIIGSLGKVVESTLVTDVAEPCKLADTNWVKPGVVSWIYWAYNHGSNDYNIIQKYVDLAAALKLPYVLIDAEWDEMDKVASNEGKTIEDAVAYAKSQGVKPLIWYNSSVGWVNGAPSPKFRLNKAEDREREFAWCEQLGVAGVKIDFFSGDNQQNMDYCIDLLESAARHHLLVNFHGATIPRGWQRTYPNLLSTEGVYGAEWYNNVATFTDKAACHNATLPFTRNVIGPMDYTPCAFSDSQHPHITTHAHELALTVLFESGLQHLADRPESILAQPQRVQNFFSSLPAAWDETRFITGYPGKSVVLARHSGTTWYVAGINGTDEQQTIALSLDFVKGKNPQITLFADAPAASTTDQQAGKWLITQPDRLPTAIGCEPRGGFVMVIAENENNYNK